MNKKTRKRIIWSVVALVLCLTVLAGGIYLSHSYTPEPAATALLTQEHVIVEENRIVFRPEGATIAGLIFYPGGQVAPEAYAPLMDALAKDGLLCVLLRMPLNLAVLSPNRAEGVRQDFPEVTRWYMGGHSLGGAMAASYISKHAGDFQGLILLAAYSTEDLSASGLDILSIYGSEDGVMNRESYAKYAPNLPKNATELVIPGGCHAYFGAYGPQKGDGSPTITPAQQREQTVQAILELLNAI